MSGSMIYVNSKSYIVFDNLEIKNYKATGNYGPSLIGIYKGSNITIQNSYIHDWRTTTTKDGKLGGVFAASSSNIVVDNCEISNANNIVSNTTSGLAVGGVQTVRNSEIHDVHTAIFFGRDVHDNEIYNLYGSFDPSYHENVIWGSGSSQIYNNLIYSIYQAGTIVYPVPCWGGKTGNSVYVYNNIVDVSAGATVPAIQADPSGGSDNCADVYIYNNTIVTNGVATRIVNRGYSLDSYHVKNNHVITSSAESSSLCYDVGSCFRANNYEKSNNLLQTPQKAEAQGYTSTNMYVPISADSATVGAGVSASFFSHDFMNNPRTGSYDIGAHQYSGEPSDPTQKTPSSPKNLRIIN
jgi:hypothetical protein